MRQSNIFSGAAFRASAVSSILFLITMIFVGVTIYQITKWAMMKELERQISEEAILFQQIYQQGGQTALLNSIKNLENQQTSTPNLVGLFDSNLSNLAGNTSLAPDFIGWKTISAAMKVQDPNTRHHVFAQTMDSSTLVVGRHMKLIDSVLKTLTWILVIAGSFVTLCSLLTGYFSSRRVFFKLNRLAGTLDEISQGNTNTRLVIDNSNDQIDKISKQINSYLDQLSSLIDSTKNSAISIAHDLRTPLNRAMVKLEQAKESHEHDNEKFKLIEQAELEMTNVNEIFDTILRISRIENNKDDSGFEKISANRLLNEMFEIYQVVVEEANQKLVYRPSESNNVLIVGDKKMLQQLLSNLIENAMFHSPQGTVITISYHDTPLNEVVIEVSDNGPGIPAEERESVLDPFHRLNASRNQPGSGLGLALVNAITNRHYAKLALLDNNPGLRVRIEFPILN